MTPSDSAASSAAAGTPTAPADTFVAPEFAASAESGTACAAAWNPIFEWVPSQKGFFVDAPQRQSTVLACVGKMFPLVSRSSIVPVTTYGPFGLASIVTSAMSNPPSSEISSIDDYRKPRSMRNHPTYARFRRFRDEDRACVQLGQRQFAVAANKGRSKPARSGTRTLKRTALLVSRLTCPRHCPHIWHSARHAGASGTHIGQVYPFGTREMPSCKSPAVRDCELRRAKILTELKLLFYLCLPPASHSSSLDQRRRPATLHTAIATAFV